MKKLLPISLGVLFSIVSLCAKADCSDGPYGIIVNNSTIYDATNTGEADFQGRTQYLAHANLNAGDIIQLINQSCDAIWMVDLDPYGEYQKFEGGASAGQLVCKESGCYDFYIKLQFENDLLYIGPGTDCSDAGHGNNGGNTGGNTGDGGNTGTVVTGDFYLIGYWNGQNVGESDADYDKFYDEYRMADCKWTGVLPSSDPYAYVRAKLMLNNGTGWMFYSTEGWQGDNQTELTFYSADYLYKKGTDGQSEKWAVPANQTLYITLTVVSADEIKMRLVSQTEYEAHDCGLYTPGTTPGTGETPNDNAFTVRCQKPADWSTLYIYSWGGTSFGDWPGSPMTDDGNGYYSANITAGTSIIFNDNGTVQTVDIDAVNAPTCYAVSANTDGEGKYFVDVINCPDNTMAVEQITGNHIQLIKGSVVCDTDFRIFNISGQDVTVLNGNLHGLFIISTEYGTQKIVLQ